MSNEAPRAVEPAGSMRDLRRDSAERPEDLTLAADASLERLYTTRCYGTTDAAREPGDHLLGKS
jgi:hypothetical protein